MQNIKQLLSEAEHALKLCGMWEEFKLRSQQQSSEEVRLNYAHSLLQEKFPSIKPTTTARWLPDVVKRMQFHG
jgi:hypothetical protein